MLSNPAISLECIVGLTLTSQSPKSQSSLNYPRVKTKVGKSKSGLGLSLKSPGQNILLPVSYLFNVYTYTKY